MSAFEVIKKFIKSSSVAEKAALSIYERLPLSLRNRVFYGPMYFHWLSFLQESETWDKEMFEGYQFERTKQLLLHASRNVPYYRKLFCEAGFQPEKMQSLDELQMLPYLEKETVRDSALAFVDERIPFQSLTKMETSGSTGIPLTVYRTRESIAAFNAFRDTIAGRTGHTPKSREVMFWPLVELGRRADLPYMKFGNKLVFSIRYLSGKWISQCYSVMREFDPAYIKGFPSVLAILASYIRMNSLPNFRNVKAVLLYAETLYDWQREVIEEVFGRVFSFYSITERAVIGGECEHSFHLHLHPAYGHVEFADTVHGYKEIIATGIVCDTMPFIRYRTGDIVARYNAHCPQCGRHHNVVDRVEGRTQDFLIGKEGEIIPRMMAWIKRFPRVLQVQFYQDTPGKAYLKIVREKNFIDSDMDYIKSKLSEMLDVMADRIDIEIVPVNEIQTLSSGKVKIVDQKLDMKEFL